MTSDIPVSLAELGEFGLIDRLHAIVGQPAMGVGIGDDAAVLPLPDETFLLATVDLLVEGVHFRRSDAAPFDLGRRALAVNLSDIAAMGGCPRWALVSLGLPEDVSVAFVEDLYLGLKDEGDRFATTIVGGNISRTGGPLTVDVVLLGSAQKVVRRNGARPGDAVVVTGHLGLRAAVFLAVTHPKLAPPDLREQVRSAFVPEPRIGAGLSLARSGRVHAMLDVSDGLAGDAVHLTRAGEVDVVIDTDALPIDDVTRRIAAAFGRDPVELALTGGEDYELLFTCSPENVEALAQELAPLPLQRVGDVASGTGTVSVRRNGRPLNVVSAGWRHF